MPQLSLPGMEIHPPTSTLIAYCPVCGGRRWLAHDPTGALAVAFLEKAHHWGLPTARGTWAELQAQPRCIEPSHAQRPEGPPEGAFNP